MGRLIGVSGALLVAVVAAGCAGGEEGTARAPVSPSSSAGTYASPTPSSTSQPPRVACRNRPAKDEIFVRYLTPGMQTTAQRLGGGWAWDESVDECVTGVEFVLRANPPGSCTQVGRVGKNRSYDVDERPAPPLKSVEEERGDC